MAATPLDLVAVVPGLEGDVLVVGVTGVDDVGVAGAVAKGDVVAALAEALVDGEDEAGDGSVAGAGVALTGAHERDVEAEVSIEVDGEGAVVVVLDPALAGSTGSKGSEY